MKLIASKTGKKYLFRKLVKEDAVDLGIYFERLSNESKKKFQPHPLTTAHAEHICTNITDYAVRFVLCDFNNSIIGYFLLDFGLIAHELNRYKNHGVDFDTNEVAFFAPSLADNFQNLGLASCVMPVIIDFLKTKDKKVMVLLGGVRESNSTAIAFYEKMGFVKVGGYQTDVWNFDMILKL